MKRATVATESNGGRQAHGRFGAGNRFAKGNPTARKVARFRAAIIRAVKPDDIEAVITTLLDKAKSGDIAAAREFLDRILGKPAQTELLARLERLEALFSERAEDD